MLVAFAIVAVLSQYADCLLTRVKPNACFQEMMVGGCSQSLRRFYYDSGNAVCKSFTYSGCGKNENNFASLAECQKTCTDVCNLPQKSGPCEAAIPAYYFDTNLGRCQSFLFGGCDPNANNFPSMDACRRMCPDANPVCMEKEYVGNAVDPSYEIRWAFSPGAWGCKPFVYAGTGGNNNNFEDRNACRANCPLKDLCRFPAERGPCEQNVQRWHYDEVSGKCMTFNYGGCLGNENNFDSKGACEARCPKIRRQGDGKPIPEICALPKSGEASGEEGQDRYFYNPELESCRYFLYSGKGGNENNFKSVEECELNCPEKSPCAEPVDQGFGSDKSQLRYRYDISTGECMAFVYHGNGGNRNRFNSKAQCQDICIGCSKKSDRGPCLALQRRFFFNKVTGECERFIYGGCQGNKNRFSSAEECYRRCQ